MFDRHPIIHSLKPFITSADSWCLLAACGGSLSGAGTIRSPYYPRMSPHPKTCEWIITQLPGKVVVLNFVDFDVRNATTCDSDYIEVKNSTHILWKADRSLSVCSFSYSSPPKQNCLTDKHFYSSYKNFSRFIMGPQIFSLFSKVGMPILIIRDEYQMSLIIKDRPGFGCLCATYCWGHKISAFLHLTPFGWYSPSLAVIRLHCMCL